MTVGVLASGNGSNLQALIDAQLPVRVVIVNRADARALARAEAAGIEGLFVDHRAFPSREAFDEALAELLAARGVRLVALAGFMRIVGRPLLERFPNAIVNVHPALLPSFPGLHAQRQALAAGVKLAGCSIHLVDEGTDTGPILAQAAVPVFASDDEPTLSARILAEEHRLYPAVVRAILDGRLRVEGRRAHLEGGLPGLPSGAAALIGAGAPR